MKLPSLSSLAFYSTGICAQIDDEFQGWMRTLSDARPAECDVETVERYALSDLHDRTAGSSWTSQSGWNGDGPLGSWQGVTTEGGRVRELTLANNGLRGPLPAELANLTELRVLDLRGNDLTGELPTAFATLSALAELSVPDNARLDGVLPFDLTRLRSVKVLHHTGTGLCASPSTTFQTWYSGIDDTSGAICGNPDEVAVSLPIVYLTQSVQSPSRNVRLVADRDALLRVFVTGDQPPRLLRAHRPRHLPARRPRGAPSHHRAPRRRDRDRGRRGRARPLLQRGDPGEAHRAGHRDGGRGGPRRRDSAGARQRDALPGGGCRAAERRRGAAHGGHGCAGSRSRRA